VVVIESDNAQFYPRQCDHPQEPTKTRSFIVGQAAKSIHSSAANAHHGHPEMRWFSSTLTVFVAARSCDCFRFTLPLDDPDARSSEFVLSPWNATAAVSCGRIFSEGRHVR
jgi:hypothetical protein